MGKAGKKITFLYNIVTADNEIHSGFEYTKTLNNDQIKKLSSLVDEDLSIQSFDYDEDVVMDIIVEIEHLATAYLKSIGDPVALAYDPEENELLPFDCGYSIELKIKEKLAKTKIVTLTKDPWEKRLLLKLDSSLKEPLDAHFVLLDLENLYYRNRSDVKCLTECIKCCEADLALLDKIIENYNRYSNVMNTDNLDCSVEELNKSFIYRELYPYTFSYDRIEHCYEYLGDYKKAIEWCEKAMRHCKDYEADEMYYEAHEKRYNKYVKKINKLR